jgi:hypothetical protein
MNDDDEGGCGQLLPAHIEVGVHQRRSWPSSLGMKFKPFDR